MTSEPLFTYRILCTGSRDCESAADTEIIQCALEDAISRAHGRHAVIVHGGAVGADSIVDRLARRMGCVVEVHSAAWTAHGSAAGPMRNAKMVRLGADECLAFWHGRNDRRSGTLDCFSRATQAKIPTRIYPVSA